VRRSLAHASAQVLRGALRLTGAKGYRYLVTSLQRNLHQPFELEGIRYYPQPCSVGLTGHGHITGASAADMVIERGLSHLRVLDICCGTGIVGLTMLARLRGQGCISAMTLADINVFNLTSIEKTLARGAADQLAEYDIEVVLSDGLDHIIDAEPFDLIVSNPPHYLARDDPGSVDPDELGTYDADWGFHRRFYAGCHGHLLPGGEVWFLENRDAAAEAELRAIVAANPNLDPVGSFDDRRDPGVYWMQSRRRA
jgi:methylase of polypeptide subunit release factors